MKQAPKKGKVVRASVKSWKLIQRARLEGEKITHTLERILTKKLKYGKSLYVLPEDACSTLSEAKGKAILKAVKKKTTEQEVPIEVVEVL